MSEKEISPIADKCCRLVRLSGYSGLPAAVQGSVISLYGAVKPV
jgi:hypothetical protein